MAYDYIRNYYGIGFNVGERVKHRVLQKNGNVTREDKGNSHYVMVKMDGRKHSVPCHPEELEKVYED